MLTEAERQAQEVDSRKATQKRIGRALGGLLTVAVLLTVGMLGVEWGINKFLLQPPKTPTSSEAETVSQPTASDIIEDTLNNAAEGEESGETSSDPTTQRYEYTEINGLIPERTVPDEEYQNKAVVSIIEEGLEFAVPIEYEGHLELNSRITMIPEAPEGYQEVWTYDVVVDGYTAGSLYITHMDYLGNLEKIIDAKLRRVMDMDTVFTVGWQELVDVPEELNTWYVQPSTLLMLSQGLQDTIRFKE